MEILLMVAIIWLSQKLELPEAQMVRVSWYGPGLHGQTMANGERFNRNDPQTVAHRNLPFNTPVLFFCPEKQTGVVGFVRDRGPFIPGREFDLSEAGAEILGFKNQGLATIQALVLSPPG
ncbi:MAG: septal ring lytic transglycosylase RlpA family protein [Patescibacteria group bacterium]